jgi:hypothetical protein
MSLIVAPEAVAVVTPPIVVRPTAPRPDTRPVEASDKANAGTSQQKQDTASRDPSTKPEPSARPPGTDPSLPPQTIFDASLISEDFKPSLHTGPPAPEIETGTGSGIERGGDSPASVGDDTAGSSDSGTRAAFDPAQDGNHPIEVKSIASYARAGGGSALNVPGNANPDWLTAIEKIA